VEINSQAIFWLQVRVSGDHLCNLPGVQALHFGVETAKIFYLLVGIYKHLFCELVSHII
jgi:hypothetical protein